MYAGWMEDGCDSTPIYVVCTGRAVLRWEVESCERWVETRTIGESTESGRFVGLSMRYFTAIRSLPAIL